MKIPPAVWGPLFWHTIHIVAIGYPQSPSYAQKRAAKEFFESLSFLIPCPVCREHYQTHLQKSPISPHLDSNKVLKKPVLLESEVIYFYKRVGARGKNIVVNQDTIDEVDLRSMIKGGLMGAGTVLVGGSLIWLATR